MHIKGINEPKDLSRFLIETFPVLEKIWIKEGGLEEEDERSFHSIWQLFGPESHGILSAATDKQIKKLCALINRLVSENGEPGNAVSTCFLEHASQFGIRKVLKPHLSKEAKDELC